MEMAAIEPFDLFEYFHAVRDAQAKNTDLRYGQVMFNTLHEMRPDLAAEIKGTDLDPFYIRMDDPAMGTYLDWLREKAHKEDI